MLKNMAKGNKSTKDKNKQVKQKKQVKKVQETNEEEEQNTQLIDIEQQQNKQTKDKKVKRDNVKKNEFVLQEKLIDTADIQIQKTEQVKKPITSWVANSVQQVMKKDFKMEDHQHEFQSITDKEFNQKNKERKKKFQAQNKNKPVESNGILLQPLQKSKDQLLLQKAENSQTAFTKNQPKTSLPLPIQPTEKKFTNSNINNNFIQIEKTPQQIRMQQMQKLQQQKVANPPPKTSWLGKKSETTTNSKPIEFKKTPITFTNSNANNNINMVPLQRTQQQKKMQDRPEQQMKFLSKKQIEERKKKREEKEIQQKQKQQKQVK